MKLKQLQYLLAVVDNGLNITAASEALFATQPGVSKQINLLEDELNLPLFTRRGRSLTGMTPAGETIVQRARVVMKEIENMQSLAGELARQDVGELKIATTNTQARYVLPPVIQSFRVDFPDVALHMHQGTSEQIADMVEQGDVDFAIATSAQRLFPSLCLLPAYRWDRIVLVPNDHPLTELERGLTLADLAEHPLVTYVYTSRAESSLFRSFNAEGMDPNVAFTARDADVIKTYVRMGVGVGILASMAYQPEIDHDLTALDATGLFPRLTSWIGFPRDAVLRGYMYRFLELFGGHLTKRRVDEARALASQAAVDEMFAGVELPLRE